MRTGAYAEREVPTFIRGDRIPPDKPLQQGHPSVVLRAGGLRFTADMVPQRRERRSGSSTAQAPKVLP